MADPQRLTDHVDPLLAAAFARHNLGDPVTWGWTLTLAGNPATGQPMPAVMVLAYTPNPVLGAGPLYTMAPPVQPHQVDERTADQLVTAVLEQLRRDRSAALTAASNGAGPA